MFSFDSTITVILCLIWVVLSVLLVMDARSEKGSSGMTLVYLASLTLSHLPGGAILLVPWYEFYPRNWTFTGLVFTVIGLGAFCVGVLIARILLDQPIRVKKPTDLQMIRRIALLLIFSGLVIPIVFVQFVPIPTLSALISSFWLMGAPGLCLYAYVNHKLGRSLLSTVLAAIAFPISTILMLGFLGFGLSFAIIVTSFCVAKRYVSNKILLFVPLLIYGALSVGLNYFFQREAIREAVWLDNASLGVRAESVAKVFTDFEWFDADNFFHLKSIDGRMNQNYLVGASVEALDSGRTEFMMGESLYFAAVAWVPRVIWVDKPSVAGSGDLVARLSGLDFDSYTSIGVGHILELYGNFGVIGLVVGMMLLGVLIRFLDLRATRHLHERQVFRWLLYIVPGLAFCNSGGQLAESVAGGVSAVVVVIALEYVATIMFRKPYGAAANQRATPHQNPSPARAAQ
jgi:hypothetical protein